MSARSVPRSSKRRRTSSHPVETSTCCHSSCKSKACFLVLETIFLLPLIKKIFNLFISYGRRNIDGNQATYVAALPATTHPTKLGAYRTYVLFTSKQHVNS